MAAAAVVPEVAEAGVVAVGEDVVSKVFLSQEYRAFDSVFGLGFFLPFFTVSFLHDHGIS